MEEFKKIIIEQNEDFHNKEKSILRDKFYHIKELSEIPHIIIISGLRRVGKSTLLQQINKNMYPKNKYSYLTFEDEKLFNFDIMNFDLLYQTFLELDKNNSVFFLDEIQNVSNWEIPIRRLYEKKIKFYITGSNASLLSRELGTKLTGRHVNIELFPFSFSEFLKFKNISYTEQDFYITKKIAVFKNLFEEYYDIGGIPDYMKYQRKELIQQIYEDILFKDILVRYNLTDEKSLRELSKYLISNIGKEFSYNKLKDFLSLGSSNTVKKYISFLESSYLIFTIEKFDYSLKKQLLNQKKVYVIDNSFANLVSFKFTEDNGRLLENLVLVELKRRNKEVYYHKGKQECDFVIKEGLKISQAIQVTISLSDLDTKKREINGILDALNTYNLKEGLILTKDEEDEIKIENKTIKVKPIWKWLLSEA